MSVPAGCQTRPHLAMSTAHRATTGSTMATSRARTGTALTSQPVFGGRRCGRAVPRPGPSRRACRRGVAATAVFVVEAHVADTGVLLNRPGFRGPPRTGLCSPAERAARSSRPATSRTSRSVTTAVSPPRSHARIGHLNSSSLVSARRPTASSSGAEVPVPRSAPARSRSAAESSVASKWSRMDRASSAATASGTAKGW